MFTLRKITTEGLEMNFIIGSSYALVDSERAPKEFSKILERDEYYKSQRDKIYAFITTEATDILCLFNTDRNYIMGENGKTVDNLTQR